MLKVTATGSLESRESPEADIDQWIGVGILQDGYAFAYRPDLPGTELLAPLRLDIPIVEQLASRRGSRPLEGPSSSGGGIAGGGGGHPALVPRSQAGSGSAQDGSAAGSPDGGSRRTRAGGGYRDAF